MYIRLLLFCVLFLIFLYMFYKVFKKRLLYWDNELKNESSLEDRANKLKTEGDQLHDDLIEREKDIKTEEELINNLKKKGF